MAGIKNSGQVIGRLAADVMSFANKDGSKKVYLALMVDRNWVASDGQRGSDRVSLEAWVSAATNGLGVYDHMHVGDLVALTYSVRSGSYVVESTGEVVYQQSLVVDRVELLEPRSVTVARRERRLAAVEPAPTTRRSSRAKVAAAS